MSTPSTTTSDLARPRRKVWVYLIIIVALCAVVIAGDRLLARYVENTIESSIAHAGGVVTAPPSSIDEGDVAETARTVNVSIVDAPFLTQVVRGTISKMEVSVPGWDVDVAGSRLRLNDIHVSLSGTATSSPYHAEAVEGRGRVNQESLQQLLDEQLPKYVSMPATVSVTDEGVSIHMEILGQKVTAKATLSIGDGGRSLVVTPTTVQAGELNIPLDSLLEEFHLDDLRVPLDPLPAGIVISSLLTSDNGHITATLTGHDIDLATLF